MAQDEELVSVARATRAVDPSSWQRRDESTLVQGGWTAVWRDGTEVSARADVKQYCSCLPFREHFVGYHFIRVRCTVSLPVLVFCYHSGQSGETTEGGQRGQNSPALEGSWSDRWTAATIR